MCLEENDVDFAHCCECAGKELLISFFFLPFFVQLQLDMRTIITELSLLKTAAVPSRLAE